MSLKCCPNSIDTGIHLTPFNMFNSLRPGDACMRHWTGSSLFQVMAWRLFGAKPLHEPVFTYCQLGLGTNFSEILIEIQTFSLNKICVFTRKYAFGNVVCEMAAILSRPHCVNVCPIQWRRATTHYWPFVMEIYRWPLVYITKGQ